MVGSVHSHVSEYNQQGLLTRCTITITNSYASEPGLATPGAQFESHPGNTVTSRSFASNERLEIDSDFQRSVHGAFEALQPQDHKFTLSKKHVCPYTNCTEAFDQEASLRFHSYSHADEQLKTVTRYLNRAMNVLWKTGKTDKKLKAEIESPLQWDGRVFDERTEQVETWDVYDHELQRIEDGLEGTR